MRPLIVLAAALLVPLPVPAAEEDARGTLAVVLENDLFYDLDRHYTNGIQVEWTPKATPAWARELRASLPLFPKEGTLRTGWSLGQKMYTPEDITLEDPPQDSQPYAGWLYGAYGLRAERGDRLDRLQLSLGVVGPASLAGPTQRLVHEVRGFDRPEGWDTQLDNEPAVLLQYQHSRRTNRPDDTGLLTYDLTPYWGGGIGNVLTYANLGADFRFGHELPDDAGPLRIQPSLPGSGFKAGSGTFGWYVFAGVEGRAVWRNLFLDGNTAGNSRSVDKKPLVSEVQMGVALALGRIGFAYTHVWRSPEFDGQKGYDEFGAVSASLRF